ncbi:MAG TPA: alpha/beta hydrolase [Chitinophagaceae bacterium]|nr:alpha/beta hydrolase [Chitinophagaceae bacterium]
MSKKTLFNISFNGLISTLFFLQPLAAQNKYSENDIYKINDIVYKLVAYQRMDTSPLRLDVYRNNKVVKEKLPTIILIHGGGFWEGDKRSDLYVKMATAFALHGYVAISINYRLKDKTFSYTKSILDTCIVDVMDAMEWVYSNSSQYGIDTSNIIICGDSAGAGIAVNTSYDPAHAKYFRACIDLWGGLPDSTTWDAPIFKNGITKYTPPTCIIHGTSDNIIPYKTSRQLSRKLKAAGIYNELHPLRKADHYPVQLVNYFVALMIAFSDKILKRI